MYVQGSLVPRPCAFVACSTKFTCSQALCVCRLQYEIHTEGLHGRVHHVMSAAAYITTILLRMNDVIGCARVAFFIE